MRPCITLLCVLTLSAGGAAQSRAFERLDHRNPGLIVDLGVGLWAQPLPMDYDDDGDWDLVVATSDVPYNGVYFFENTEGNVADPVFKPAVRLGDAVSNLSLSQLDGSTVVTSPRKKYPQFAETCLTGGERIRCARIPIKGRTDQWRYHDYNGDGQTDLVISRSDWSDYGWDDAYNESGRWTHGPIHGYVFVAINTASNDEPVYADPVQLEAGGAPLDVFGCPSPCFADWDGDGDMDLVCGEFLDGLTYFENIGTRSEPLYARGRWLTHNARSIRMDLQMLQVTALDWDRDGDTDLIVGQEDGRVAFLENTGDVIDRMPHFLPPRFFRQEADHVKIGALCTPSNIDWDGDGDDDLIVGDTAGYLSLVENLDGGDPPQWAATVYLEAGGSVIRIQAGPNGSIQGPAEAKWGYTAPCAADWNGDGLPDIVTNSIWGEILWYENEGTRTAPRLKPARPVEVQWEGPAPRPEWNWWNPRGNQLVTQWRTTPYVIDLNKDGLADLVVLDHEGYLAFFERRTGDDGLELLPGKRIFFDDTGAPLQLNARWAGKSGRRKLVLADWDGDGMLDLLVNGTNIDFWRNVSDEPGRYAFKLVGPVAEQKLAGHTTSPTIVDWDKNDVPDLLAGAEDGFLYYLKRGATHE